MTSLRPDASASQVLDTLRGTRGELQNVQGTSRDTPDALRKYLSWANDSVRMLGSALKAADLDRLITSRRYWVLQTLVPADSGTLRQLVDVEIAERIVTLGSEIQALERELSRWEELEGAAAAVLDTNVLLDHHHELATRDWRADLGLDRLQALVLAVPIAVVDQLDRLKLDRRDPPKGKPSTRSRARLALRQLEDTLKEPGEWARLSLGTYEQAPTHLALIVDDLGHTPLDHVDSEIIDRALTLKPFAKDVVLVAYDTGIVFRAREAGLETHHMRYPEDDEA